MSQNHGENGVNPQIQTVKGYGAKGWYGTVWIGDAPAFSAAGYDDEAELDGRLERFIKSYRAALLKRCGEHPAVTDADIAREELRQAIAPVLALKVVR